MSTNTQGVFLRKNLLFWARLLAVCCIALVIAGFFYNRSATTYYSIDSIPEPHRGEIIFMRENHYITTSNLLYNYSFVDGVYSIKFALFYSLTWLLVFAVGALTVFYGYHYLKWREKKKSAKAGKRQVNHVASMSNLEKEMRHYRFQNNNCY